MCQGRPPRKPERKPWTVISVCFMRRSNIIMAMLDRGFSPSRVKTNSPCRCLCRVSRIARASTDNGTVCGAPAFMRSLGTFQSLERYRSQLAVLTAERQPEIDALSHKLARQEQAIARFLDRQGEAADMSEQV